MFQQRLIKNMGAHAAYWPRVLSCKCTSAWLSDHMIIKRGINNYMLEVCPHGGILHSPSPTL